MNSERATALTTLFHRIRDGDAAAEQNAVELVYQELREAAGAVLRSPGGLLQPTSLVHEAWLKLNGKLDHVRDRRHFLALAVRAMRQVLSDAARAEQSDKRGGGHTLVTLSKDVPGPELADIDVAQLHEALQRLRQSYARHAEVLELRALGAMRLEDIAELLNISETTVRADLKFARAWLVSELKHAGND